jgi:hypothetical protein
MRAADSGSVLVNDRGSPAHAAPASERHQGPVDSSASIIDMLAMPGDDAVSFTHARAGKLHRPAELSFTKKGASR